MDLCFPFVMFVIFLSIMFNICEIMLCFTSFKKKATLRGIISTTNTKVYFAIVSGIEEMVKAFQ